MNAEQTPQDTDPHGQAMELDPVVRALAEARAREAGKTLSEYLSEVLLLTPALAHPAFPAEFLAPSVGRWLRWHGGGSWQGGGGSPFAAAPPRTGLTAMSHEIRERETDLWAKALAAYGPLVSSEPSTSPALNLVFVFNYRIQSAALLMSAAFHEAAVEDFDFASLRSPPVYRRQAKSTWYHSIMHDVLDCSNQLRHALTHRWTPTPRAERLAIDAFVVLSDLTPARTELLRLCRYDRTRAFSELAKHIDLATTQFRLSADLLAEVEGATRTPELSEKERFSVISRSVLQRAGGGISLTEAAKLLGVSRQALHKRVKLGSALGLMDGSELTLPKFQFVGEGKNTKIVEGLGPIVKLFDTTKAGRWSALQFLTERDPNLGGVPSQALKDGRAREVLDAAIAYLDASEA
jgi:hypothetical protein